MASGVVVVLGGGGLTGRCAVRDLVRGGRFGEVRVGDLDERLADAAASAAGPSAVPQAVDVRRPESLRAALIGADVCVNAVQYQRNLDVMAGCLDAKVPYLDFGGLFHMTRRQLGWDARFRERGLLAIPGLGQVPGVSNVLARAATQGLERVESIVMRDGWRDLTKGAPEVVFTWSPSTFLDEMTLPAQVFENGQYRAYVPMSGAELFDFLPPVGPTHIYRTLHSEPATLPESLADRGLARCEWKEGGPGIELMRGIARIGLGADDPVVIEGHPIRPRQLLLTLLRERGLLGFPAGVVIDDWEVLDVEVRGTQGGRPVERHGQARFPPKPDWQLSATEYAVGVCGAIGAEFIASGTITQRGVVPPERCIEPEPFRKALRERGIATALRPQEPALAAEFRRLPSG